LSAGAADTPILLYVGRLAPEKRVEWLRPVLDAVPHARLALVGGVHVTAYAVDASPALVVQHAILEFALRRPSLVISGVNFGLNMTTEVTISGTVGAALEASSFGIPALALSLEMGTEYHLMGNADADYSAAKDFAPRFAWYQLIYAQTHDVDALNINIPSEATPRTPWRLTRLSRKRPVQPLRDVGKGLGAVLFCPGTDCDQVPKVHVPRKVHDVLGVMPGQVEPDLTHDLLGQRVDRVWFRPSAVHSKAIACISAQKRLRHLAAARVSCAEKQNICLEHRLLLVVRNHI
jgi:hypothetical protein